MPEISADIHPKVFISYRRQISDGYAGRLYDRIINRFGGELKIFMDVDAIAPGEDFVKAIENAVAKCDVLIAVIGKDWLDVKDEEGNRRLDNPEDFVRLEIAAALDRNIRVIPVLVQGEDMPTAKELPENLQPLRRRNAVSLSNERWNYDAERMIKAIADELGIEPVEKDEVPKTVIFEYKKLLLITAALSSVLTIGIYTLILRLNTPAAGNTNINANRTNDGNFASVNPEYANKAANNNSNNSSGTDYPANYIITLNTNVQLRGAPRTSSPVTGNLLMDSKVRLIHGQGNWYQVEVIKVRPSPSGISANPGDIGWIFYVMPESDSNSR